MTKYILHGGFKEGLKQINDGFFREILNCTARGRVNVLLVYFATDNGDEYYSEDIEQFVNNNLEKRELDFKKASVEEFESQVEWADVVYLHGGNSMKMLEKMEHFPDFGKKIVGKVVVGDSAGSNFLSKVFYSKRNGACRGSGILPIKFIPHFEIENDNKLDDLEGKMETIKLKEYEYKVLVG